VRTVRKQFFLFLLYNRLMFESLPFSPRQVKATESRLRSIYDAARAGLRGDALAFAAGMLPTEYRQLTQLDPVVELAEQKGRADSEIEMSTIMRNAALAGDAKMALEFLKHKHDWVAKQQVQVDVTQQISIITALEQAQTRVLEGLIIDEADYRANDNRPLINNREKDGDDYQDINPKQTQRVADL
jgi:hypothetical protein